MQDYDEGIKWSLKFADNVNYDNPHKRALIFLSVREVLQNKNYGLIDKVASYLGSSGYANFFMSCLYVNDEFPQKNEKLAVEYLKKGAELGSYSCMASVPYYYLQEKDTVSAERLACKMMEKNYPVGYVYMGDIEQGRGNHSAAYNYYMQAVSMKNADAAVSVAECLLEGKGVRQDIAKAKEYAQMGLEYARSNNENTEYAQKVLDRCDAALANGGVVPKETDDAPDISMLQALADTDKPEEERIGMAEDAMKSLFATPGAVVKTVGSNGTTIVATETAEDFLLTLCTMPSKVQVILISSETDSNGKITQLTVQLKK